MKNRSPKVGFRNVLIPVIMHVAICTDTLYAVTSGIVDGILQAGMEHAAFQSKTDEPTATVHSVNQFNYNGFVAIGTNLESLRNDAIASKSTCRAIGRQSVQQKQGSPHAQPADKYGRTCKHGRVPSGRSNGQEFTIAINNDDATSNRGSKQEYATRASDDGVPYQPAPFWLKFGKEWSSDVTGDGPCQMYQGRCEDDECESEKAQRIKERVAELQQRMIDQKERTRKNIEEEEANFEKHV